MPPTETRLTRALGCTVHEDGWAKCATLGATGFPLADFKHSLTLFSKFFASFPHGTCSLSVSHQYLALDGIYHLFGLQSQANRLVEDRPYGLTRGTDGIVTLSDALFQGTSPRVAPGLASVDYNPTAVAASLQSGLVPLHSPLLRESLLVSFPPLSYMLKFSGSSCVTETQEMSVSSYRDGVPRLRRALGLVLSAASPRPFRSANL